MEYGHHIYPVGVGRASWGSKLCRTTALPIEGECSLVNMVIVGQTLLLKVALCSAVDY